MATQRVIEFSVGEFGKGRAARGRSNFAVVFTGLLNKRAGLPPFHSRGEHRDMIDSAALHRRIPANLLETFPPE